MCAATTLQIGEMYMANSSGLSTLPCGTQDVQLANEDCLSPTAAYCLRQRRKIAASWSWQRYLGCWNGENRLSLWWRRMTLGSTVSGGRRTAVSQTEGNDVISRMSSSLVVTVNITRFFSRRSASFSSILDIVLEFEISLYSSRDELLKVTGDEVAMSITTRYHRPL